jgi:hypothetical protein
MLQYSICRNLKCSWRKNCILVIMSETEKNCILLMLFVTLKSLNIKLYSRWHYNTHSRTLTSFATNWLLIHLDAMFKLRSGYIGTKISSGSRSSGYDDLYIVSWGSTRRSVRVQLAASAAGHAGSAATVSYRIVWRLLKNVK